MHKISVGAREVVVLKKVGVLRGAGDQRVLVSGPQKKRIANTKDFIWKIIIARSALTEQMVRDEYLISRKDIKITLPS